MASDITAIPRWTTATTIDGAEAPNDANWLAILQTHANRQSAVAACLAETWTKSDASSTGVVRHKAFADKFHGLCLASALDRVYHHRLSDLVPQTYTLVGTSLDDGVASPDGVIVIAESGGSGGVHESTDGGLTFTARATGTDTMNRVIWTGQNFVAIQVNATAPVYTSPDGQSWTQRVNTTGGGGAIATNGSGVVISPLASSLTVGMRSMDHGVTWAPITMPATFLTELAYLRATDTWYATDGFGADYLSTDNGDTWSSWSWSISYAAAATWNLLRIAATDSVLLAITDDPATRTIIGSRDGANFSVLGSVAAFAWAELDLSVCNDAPVALASDIALGGGGTPNTAIAAPIWTG